MYSKNFLDNDLKLLNAINEKDRRNYHLWKYIINISNLYKELNDKKKILNFCVDNFLKDTYDYSAYSCSVNLIKILDKDDIKLILERIVNVIPIIESKSEYIESFINLLNKK
jgi:hypothetical protein